MCWQFLVSRSCFHSVSCFVIPPFHQHLSSILLFTFSDQTNPNMVSLISSTPIVSDLPSFAAEVVGSHLNSPDAQYNHFIKKCHEISARPQGPGQGPGTASFEEMREFAEETNINNSVKFTSPPSLSHEVRRLELEGWDNRVSGQGLDSGNFLMKSGRFVVGENLMLQNQGVYFVKGVAEVGLDFVRFHLEMKQLLRPGFEYHSLVVPDFFVSPSHRRRLHFLLRRISFLQRFYRTLIKDFGCSPLSFPDNESVVVFTNPSSIV